MRNNETFEAPHEESLGKNDKSPSNEEPQIRKTVSGIEIVTTKQDSGATVSEIKGKIVDGKVVRVDASLGDFPITEGAVEKMYAKSPILAQTKEIVSPTTPLKQEEPKTFDEEIELAFAKLQNNKTDNISNNRDTQEMEERETKPTNNPTIVIEKNDGDGVNTQI
jgi:hypothetical protein